MATIDRVQLIKDTNFWLPPVNTLIDSEISLVAELIIGQVGDDSTKYAEVLCKTLKACAIKNLSNAVAGSGAKKKQKIGDNETEWFRDSVKNGWEDYIESLSDICPLFGYSPSKSFGMFISPGDTLDVFGGRLDTDDLIL